MTAKGEPVARTLHEHRKVAGDRLDRALRAAEARMWTGGAIPEVRSLATAPPDELRSIVIALLDRAASGPGISGLLRMPSAMPQSLAVSQVLATLGNKRPPYARGDVILLLELARAAAERTAPHNEWALLGLVGQPVAAAERAVRSGGIGELAGPVRELARVLGGLHEYRLREAASYRARLLALLEGEDDRAEDDGFRIPSIVTREDTWGVAWSERLAALTPGQRSLVIQCSLATGVVPPAAWRRKTAELAEAPGAGEMLRSMLADAPTSASTKAPRTLTFDGRTVALPYPAISDANAGILRGAVWAASMLDESWVVEAITALGLHFGTSGGSSNVARDERLGNTAAAALGTMAAPAAIAGLGRLKAKVTNRNVSKQIAKALDAAASSAGLTASELLELAISPEGLGPDATREIAVGDHVAVLAIVGDDVSLTWRAPDARVTARPPVALDGEKAAVTRAKTAAKELGKALALERGRVEDLFAEDREWSVGDWRRRYLEHPLTGAIGRRLIWRLLRDGTDVASVMAADATFIAADGSPVAVGDGDRIRLWHPIDAPDAEIAAWRTLLVGRQIRQPFKQAFREVYALTPAEEQTETYSNRFAAHILRYPQARALMTARRWGSNFLGPYDGGFNGVAKRDFRAHGVRAEFWHDAIDDELQGQDGTAEHCTTDQVRFLRIGRVEEVLPLRDVPAIVLSEAMRDVDLFVSVTTIGADRNWQDGGPGRIDRFGDYWNANWDAALSVNAQTRRDALSRMLPGLEIAARLELGDRWLRVRGDLRAYRIHLGSGNILMEPSDRYLCIVPARGGASEKVFLPFDDDPTLSVILSKAFLLAGDSRIKDPTIVRQIRAG